MTQLSIDAAGPEPDRSQSQWFTPPWLAGRMAAWLLTPWILDANRRAYSLRILEPSVHRAAEVAVRLVLRRWARNTPRVCRDA